VIAYSPLQADAPALPEIDHVPSVSIGLPVYNGAEFLAQTLASILEQTFTDFELIICDNASTDGTRSICEAAAAVDDRVRYFRHEKNVGAAANYNVAYTMARGHYFKWAAHDDMLSPDFLAVCKPILDDDPGCVLVHPQTVEIDHTGKVIGFYRDRLASDCEDPIVRLRRWASRPGRCNPFFGLMRREELKKTMLHGDYPHADQIFLAEMTMLGRCRLAPAGAFFRRIHKGNSLVANPKLSDLVFWFSGKRPQANYRTSWTFLKNYIAAVSRAELGALQRLRSAGVVALVAWQKKRRLLQEVLPFGQFVERFRTEKSVLPLDLDHGESKY